MSRASKIGRREFLGGMVALGALSVAGCAGPSGGVAAGGPMARSGGGPRPAANLPGRGEFVVRDAYVMTMDPALGDVPRGDVHVRNGTIVAVGANLAGGARRPLTGAA